MSAPDLLARARRIRMLTCDVDGVLTDGKIYVGEDGREWKAFSSLDGLGLKMLARSGVIVGWITGSRSNAVSERATNLGIEHVILGAEDKLAAWERLRREFALAPDECAHIGDDLPDVAVIARCGLGATVPHAPEPVRRQAHYVTRVNGGDGAVRELAELILGAQGKLAARVEEYGG
jgi:3-deoxy-D-manno-octulosonate 8-phosphate phosphatase (KDO 8-P phosphatase)